MAPLGPDGLTRLGPVRYKSRNVTLLYGRRDFLQQYDVGYAIYWIVLLTNPSSVDRVAVSILRYYHFPR